MEEVRARQRSQRVAHLILQPAHRALLGAAARRVVRSAVLHAPQRRHQRSAAPAAHLARGLAQRKQLLQRKPRTA